ncbi:LuxR family two component transcriptional regulator [Breoghania corrubedonensis]|uniref:LuxR family two component transcriptional regulator n=1 Tax=Breoghania corrubedonensis TaxID=665038 RepID=A0A2T5VE25_9HYPH|nr:response regulator transcription factor [Breoghania corrubedonensis]PTW62010.1 LuxR family two component transcriptional regulator [Breoghania corrubedonensis]
MIILIVDDHPLVCSALEATLTGEITDCRVIQAHSGAEAMAIVKERDDIDLVLLDLKLPDVDGFQGLSQLRGAAPRVPVLVLSGLEDARLAQLVSSHGALGFLNKKASAAEIVDAVSSVLAGETVFSSPLGVRTLRGRERDDAVGAIRTLTPQQSVVLRMLGEGLLNKQIAYELSISESTVKAHVSAILKKLDVSSRMQAVLMAQGGVFDQAIGPVSNSISGSASRPVAELAADR